MPKKVKRRIVQPLGLNSNATFWVQENMATPTLATTNLTLINACDSLTGWSNIGGGPGAAVNNDVLVEGTGSISRRIDNGTGGFALDLGAGGTLDFSPGGAHEGQHIFFWINILQPDLINGAFLRLTEDVTVPTPGISFDYEIFPANEYRGGWFRACIDPRRPCRVLNNISSQIGAWFNAVRWLAFYFDMGNVGGTSHNCIIDAIHRGRGLVVTGGTSGDRINWDGIAAVDAANGYGLIQKRSGVYFMLGEWQFGDATNNCYFDDEDKTIVWENRYGRNRNATPQTISAISEDLNKLLIVEGTGTTDFINGNKTGTGNDARGLNGCTYQVSPPVSGIRTRLRIDFSDPDITNIELFGCKFQGIQAAGEEDLSVKFCADATNGPNHEVSGCVFDQCGLIDLGRVSAQNNTFSNSLESSVGDPFQEIHWEDSSASSFTNITSAATVKGGAATNLWDLNTNVSNDAIYFGSRDTFGGIQVFPAGSGPWADGTSGGAWEYWNGSSWASLGTITVNRVYDGSTTTNIVTASSAGWSGGQWASWSIPGSGAWKRRVVNGGKPLYFVRFRLPADTSASGDLARIHYAYSLENANGAALLWNSNIDLVNGLFISNIDPDTDEKSHGIEHRTSGVFSYTGLDFSGNDADILFTEVTTIDFYNGSSDATNALGNGTITGVGQSFTADGTAVAKAAFWLSKTGTPTGNLTVKIYAHSGTFGTSSVPTGAALATSVNLDVSTLTTTSTKTFIDFTTQVELTNGTKYVVTLEYSGGDGSNHVLVAYDTTSPTHGGNRSENTGTWAASSTTDVNFELYGNLVINATDTELPPATSTTTTAGTVVLKNPVVLSVKAVDQATGSAISGARVLVVAGPTGDLPDGASVSLTRSGTTVTVSHTAHGMSTGDKVLIDGANEDGYDGVHTISVVNVNSYTYEIALTPASPATGTITSTFVIIDGTTNGSGIITATRTYTSDQDIEGRIRKATSAPYYKSTPIVTQLLDRFSGLSITVPMVEDQ